MGLYKKELLYFQVWWWLTRRRAVARHCTLIWKVTLSPWPCLLHGLWIFTMIITIFALKSVVGNKRLIKSICKIFANSNSLCYRKYSYLILKNFIYVILVQLYFPPRKKLLQSLSIFITHPLKKKIK